MGQVWGAAPTPPGGARAVAVARALCSAEGKQAVPAVVAAKAEQWLRSYQLY